MGLDPWCLEEVTMDAGFASVWGFSESVEELKQKLLCVTLELEAVRANAKEEMRKREENMDQLLHLLQAITHERDAARSQLQFLLAKLAQPHAAEPCPQARGSCSVTESDSHSLGASPVESLFDSSAVASPPEFSSARILSRSGGCAFDRASAVIDGLASKRPLPQKGRLLQAVLEAGPTLQTLLLAGPLPQWRNPPPLQPFQAAPPVCAKVPGASLINDPIHGYANGPGHWLGGSMKRAVVSPCMKEYESLCAKRPRTQCSGGA